ncbi:MAG: dihydrolipoyl dehydrogenase [Planctomycetaceae bacterium]|nr:dihydrolipoyl dehydrogenase [Planctomycetaceae bacterium]
MFDVIVIGGGPGGYRAAERAGHAGLSVLLIEKRALGGVCLNEGCIPSKTLLHSAKIYDYARHGEVYGVSTKGAALDHSAVIARKNKVVQTLVSGIKGLMKASKVKVIEGTAHIVDARRVKVNDEVHEGKRLIVATGSEPVIPPIDGVAEGIKSGFVLTNREILDLPEVPKNLVVVGGGVIGLEMASYFNSAGSKVTVIEMLPQIAGATDADVSIILMDNYAKKGIEFKLNARVTAIKNGSVHFDGDGARAGGVSPPVSADKVLLSIGRKPVATGFGLENTGVLVERGAIVTDRHCLTSVPNIYAVGDVNGKYMLAHVAYREAEVAVNHLLGKRDIMRYDAVPSVIYTSPEVAGVGETEATATEKGIDYEVAKVPMMYSGRYVAENSVTDGICKVLVKKKDRTVIGVHMIGSYVSEMMVSVCMMIEMQMRVEDVQEVIFPHPTVCEIMREAVFKL